METRQLVLDDTLVSVSSVRSVRRAKFESVLELKAWKWLAAMCPISKRAKIKNKSLHPTAGESDYLNK